MRVQLARLVFQTALRSGDALADVHYVADCA
jgi:hypothetical protein